MNKNMQGEDSVMHGFLSVDINWMSDGEKENLALFTSIDESNTFYRQRISTYCYLTRLNGLFILICADV